MHDVLRACIMRRELAIPGVPACCCNDLATTLLQRPCAIATHYTTVCVFLCVCGCTHFSGDAVIVGLAGLEPLLEGRVRGVILPPVRHHVDVILQDEILRECGFRV
jgi:hypothetical protein